MMRPTMTKPGLSTRASLFFFNDTATTEIYTLSLHDALPIFVISATCIPTPELELASSVTVFTADDIAARQERTLDRKSTRLNSSHLVISYAVFCLKKKTVGTLAPPVRPRRPCHGAPHHPPGP